MIGPGASRQPKGRLMRLGSRDTGRLNTTGCLILPASLFIGVMIAGPGTAIVPAVSAWTAPAICGGTVEVDSNYYSVRPGEQGVSRTIACVTGEGKDATRDDITWQVIGIAFLIYSAIAFLLLRFLVAPWIRRRATRTLEAAGIVRPGVAGAPASPIDLGGLLARVSEAVERGEAKVVVRDVSLGEPGADAGGEEAAQRLAQLRTLRDQGLITALDYETKKAEILSRL